MTRLINQTILAITFLCFQLLLGRVIRGGDWTSPVEVRHDVQKCVSYRARLSGEFLVIQATHEAGWHTYAMDNKLRAQEKLAGKRSLGIDSPTEIVVDSRDWSWMAPGTNPCPRISPNLNYAGTVGDSKGRLCLRQRFDA